MTIWKPGLIAGAKLKGHSINEYVHNRMHRKIINQP